MRDISASFHSVGVIPLATTPQPKASSRYYVSTSNTPPLQPTAPQHMPTTTAAVQATVTPQRHSMHQRLNTGSSAGMETALEALEAMGALDFSQRQQIMTSDISNLDCESVKADPRFNPAVDALPSVPPLEISIPTSPSLLSWQQQHQNVNKRDHSKNVRVSFPANGKALRRNSDLTPQSSCQFPLDLSQASPFTRSKSFYASHAMQMKRAEAMHGLPPPYAHARGSNLYNVTQQMPTNPNLDASLEDYANGAGAVSWDEQSLFSYYTSPTDLYTSDDSDPIPLRVISPAKKSMVKRELKKIVGRFRHSKSKKAGKQLQPQHAVEEQGKDYESFGSSRGFC